MTKRREALALIAKAENITFLTGAGVSVASGIPDYRSLDGLYQGIEEPEYLLSHRCLVAEPEKFYRFVKELYHPQARPNLVHQKMVALAEQGKTITIVTQNIDQLHQQAGSQRVVNFHGNLYDCYCSKCQQLVSVGSYLESDRHLECGGQVRPAVVLYEEGLDQQTIEQSVQAVATAELIVVVGTSFKVYPFAGLIDYKQQQTPVIVVNNEDISLRDDHILLKEDAVSFFSVL